MDEEDKKDIINKVNTAGNDDGNSEDNSSDNQDDSNNDFGDSDEPIDDFSDDMGGDENSDEEDLQEFSIYEGEMGDLFLDEPKKNNMFQDGSNDILDEMKPCWTGVSKMVAENLINEEKISIFDKNFLKMKLKETFNHDSEPMVEPQIKPDIKPTPVKEPSITPSRKNKPFLPMPEVQPDPKAIKEGKFDYEVYHKTLASCFNEAEKYVIKRGYDPIEFELSDPQHVSYGQTQRYNKELTVNGKLQRKAFHIQIYRMDSGNYELNMYVN